MAINKIDGKIRIKRSTTIGATPSIPVSTDHTDGTWTDTDIYVGEYFLNTQDDKLWLRSDNGLMELVTSSTFSESDLWVDDGSNIVLTATAAGKPILPATDDTSDIGSTTSRWKDLYLGSELNVNSSMTYSVTDSKTAIYSYDANGIKLQNSKVINTSNGSGQISFDAFTSTNNVIINSDGGGVFPNLAEGWLTCYSTGAQVAFGSSNYVEVNTDGIELVTGALSGTVSVSNSNITLSADRGITFGTGDNMVMKTVDIGDWNMDTGASVAVAHGLSNTERKTIRSLQCIVRDDSDLNYYDLRTVSNTTGLIHGGFRNFSSTSIFLYRYTTGDFDNTNYDSTSYNRGWVTFWYTPDA